MSGILSELKNMVTADDVTAIGNAAIESEIILTAIRTQCDSDEEFAELMESAGIEMGLYGVISDAEIAVEASKKVVIKDFKAANFNRIAKRTAIRLAMLAEDSLYDRYAKYRKLLLETREKIYQKYGNKAKTETRRILMNGRNKSGNMTSAGGKNITDRIDKAIADADRSSSKNA